MSFWNIFCGPPKPDFRPKSNLKDTNSLRSIEELKIELKSEIWNVRSSAITEISANGYKELIPELREILRNDPFPTVQATAAIALGEFQDKASTDNIILLINKNAIPKDIGVDALRRMKDPKGASAIIQFLEDPDNAMRLLTVEALKEINNKSVGSKILNMAKKNKDIEKSKTYAMALGKLGVKESESYLLNLAEKSEPSPTLAAAYLALGRIKSKKSIPLLSGAIGKDFDKGRENSVQSLISIGDTSCLPLLYPYLKNKNKEIRYSGAEVIAEIPSPGTTSILSEILNGKEKELFGASSYVAGRLKIESLRVRIENILVDTSIPEREEIGKSLGWIGNKESIPVLIKVLNESGGEGRYGAAWSLGILEAVEAYDDLVKATKSSDKKLAAISMESIGQLKLEKSISVLESAVAQDKNMALFALSSISQIPGQKARESLHKYILSDDPPIYRPAIEFLGKRKEKESIPFLIDILKKGNGDKNRIVISALNTITGKKIQSTHEWIQESEKEK
ncbi:MAG: HEAT repeat domain-containing protein [Leptospiraceae bacterium]|nr:HEAT repeat domain-containing protein [Leptospiraceae bacterium]